VATGKSQGLGKDGFPAVPIPEQDLQPTAHWTDVLSSNLWSDGYLLNEKALAAFRQCNLGEFREYPATVLDHTGSRRSFTYLYLLNHVPPTAIDFERCEFYVTDMVSHPLGPVAVASFEDLLKKREQARKGELVGGEKFSRVEYKTLYFRPGQRPTVDLFRLSQLGIRVYITTRLRNAITESGITGSEILPNKRLFADR
jgi:hypothetical protein